MRCSRALSITPLSHAGQSCRQDEFSGNIPILREVVGVFGEFLNCGPRVDDRRSPVPAQALPGRITKNVKWAILTTVNSSKRSIFEV